MAFMTYEEFRNRKHFSKEELLGISWGTLLKDKPKDFGVIPAPPILIIDRVIEIEHKGPQGRIIAEQDVRVGDWFFQCHFVVDPIMPGSLVIEGVWQTIGVYCAVRGGIGAGRALGTKTIDFFGQIRPYNKTVTYEIDIRRFMELKDSGTSICVGDAKVSVDGEHIYTIIGSKLGTFRNITYPDYPSKSEKSVGGKLAR